MARSPRREKEDGAHSEQGRTRRSSEKQKPGYDQSYDSCELQSGRSKSSWFCRSCTTAISANDPRYILIKICETSTPRSSTRPEQYALPHFPGVISHSRRVIRSCLGMIKSYSGAGHARLPAIERVGVTRAAGRDPERLRGRWFACSETSDQDTRRSVEQGSRNISGTREPNCSPPPGRAGKSPVRLLSLSLPSSSVPANPGIVTV